MIVIVRKSKIFTFCGKGKRLHREKKIHMDVRRHVKRYKKLKNNQSSRFAGRVHDYVEKKNIRVGVR